MADNRVLYTTWPDAETAEQAGAEAVAERLAACANIFAPIRSVYRKRILRPVWKLLAEFQKALDKKVQARFFRRRSRRIAADLAHFIDKSRKVGRPLILLPEFLVPNKRAQDWFPGMAARVEILNRDIRAMVDRYDDHVRILPVAEIAESRTDKSVEAAADGFHYNAEVHQLVGVPPTT